MKANKIAYSILGLIVYLGFMIGIGFIWNTFWPIEKEGEIIYWVTKGILCLFVAFYVLITVLGKKDKAVGAIQIFFTMIISGLPLICRALYLIPYAGTAISIIIAFIGLTIYAITMVGLGFYGTQINEDGKKNKKI